MCYNSLNGSRGVCVCVCYILYCVGLGGADEQDLVCSQQPLSYAKLERSRHAKVKGRQDWTGLGRTGRGKNSKLSLGVEQGEAERRSGTRSPFLWETGPGADRPLLKRRERVPALRSARRFGSGPAGEHED